MSLFDRFILAVYTLFLTIMLFIFAGEVAGFSLLDKIYENVTFTNLEVLIAVGVLVLIGIRLFWVSVRSSEKGHTEGRYVILTDGALGEVKVSIQALEGLIVKVAGKLDGVREVKPQIYSSPKGVGIKIHAGMSPELNIPEASEKLQNLIKEQIFEVTGITVESVKVSVETIVVSKARLE
jgi:hypothetical protein